MTTKQATILKPGRFTEKAHNELIVDDIGICRTCGQVRDYSGVDYESASEETKRKASKGGKLHGAIHST